jgi:hypothetical protein
VQFIIRVCIKEGKEVLRKLEERLISEPKALVIIETITTRLEDMSYQEISPSERGTAHDAGRIVSPQGLYCR